MRRRKLSLITTVLGTVIVIGVAITSVVMLTNENDGRAASGAASAAASPANSPLPSASSTQPAISGECAFTAAGAAGKNAAVPPAKVPTTGTVTVTLRTNQGTLKFALDRKAAPCTVASFVSLVSQKFYDKSPCHRLVTSGIYVLQCGDPTGSGTGGPGYAVPDEATGRETYPAGTIAMARTSDANSGGSQFFIVYKDSPSLAQNLGTRQYTVFGKVIAGMPVANKIAAAGTNNGNGNGDGAPKLKTTIESMTTT
jgi:peptidyl-prolyl cis-trans isomerase B (cyclophilin B)